MGDGSNFLLGAAWHEQPHWYAVYTCSRHEKRVAEQLQLRTVEYYLPLYSAIRRWNHRRAEVVLPIFPGYVFVHLPLTERLRVLEVPGVVHLVSTAGRPMHLPEEEIERIRACLSFYKHAEPYPYLGPGKRVRIASGPLAGLEGVVLRQSGCTRFILSVDLIMRSIAVNVEAAELEALEQAPAALVAA